MLVTRGGGYIGSHVTVLFFQARHDVVILDNLSNSHPGVFMRIAKIAGRQSLFVNADIGDGGALARIFEQGAVDAVMHFAGLKAVGESTEKPLAYYEPNVAGTLTLLCQMNTSGVKTIVFSSSATVHDCFPTC